MGGVWSSSESPKSKKTLVFLEGNISAGKSTLIRELKANGYQVWEESVDRLTGEFVEANGKNLLQLFYDDMHKYAFKLQIASLTTRWALVKEALNSDESIVFIERSHLTDRHSFALNLFELGYITSLEWKIYNSLVNQHVEDSLKYFDGINVLWVYLRASPETSFKRVQERGRPEEKDITLEYLQSLHKKLEEWNATNDCVIDAEQNKNEVFDAVVRLIADTF